MRKLMMSKIVIIVGILVIIFIFTMFIPIQFCISSLPLNDDDDIYIITLNEQKQKNDE